VRRRPVAPCGEWPCRLFVWRLPGRAPLHLCLVNGWGMWRLLRCHLPPVIVFLSRPLVLVASSCFFPAGLLRCLGLSLVSVGLVCGFTPLWVCVRCCCAVKPRCNNTFRSSCALPPHVVCVALCVFMCMLGVPSTPPLLRSPLRRLGYTGHDRDALCYLAQLLGLCDWTLHLLPADGHHGSAGRGTTGKHNAQVHFGSGQVVRSCVTQRHHLMRTPSHASPRLWVCERETTIGWRAISHPTRTIHTTTCVVVCNAT